MQSTSIEIFMASVRLGIGHRTEALKSKVDWPAIKCLAERQGLYAIVLDGIEKLSTASRPPQDMLLEWIGEVLQGYEYRYEQYEKTISEMAFFYNVHGIKLMLLKGYACSLNWPKPNHRPCGDIDIWQFGDYKKADELVSKEKGIKIDNSHQHHTVFAWGDFSVENHYDFLNVHHHKSNFELEKIFKELGQDDSHYVELKSASTGSATKVYIPSPNLHALFLLKHSMTDFAAFSVNLRQVLDWGFFVEKHGKEVDWEWLIGILEVYNMKDFFNIMNAICVEDLGFQAGIFPSVQFLPSLKDRVLDDILTPRFPRESPKGLISRLVFKYRRWKGNAWKHEMCYNESMGSAFWSGIWNHLLKPASI